MHKKLLDYNFPEDLKQMSDGELSLLAYDIRDFIIQTVSKTGGHVASSLGATELTIALHSFFETPEDKIIWDVGHQAYVHKILTGRAASMYTLRRKGGLSGFPKRNESIYDTYDSGHASSSLSAALGYAKARDLAGENHEVIAVIGDGSLTGGVAYEALNQIGTAGSKMIIILNDNQMSIGKNTGAISYHLTKARASRAYLDIKKHIKNALTDGTGVVGKKIYNGLEHIRDALKYATLPGTIFEELGLAYIGPVDGHNIGALKETFVWAKAMNKPVVIHCVTKKGKGYLCAEKAPEKFHGIGPFDPETGALKKKNRELCFSEIFGEELVSVAAEDSGVVAISAAMIKGTGLDKFQARFPDRCFDVGIAEEHAVNFAAGLALGGRRPVVALYSTFLQRAYDQILIDVCMQNLPVVFAVDRAGNVGSDGETHHGLFDLSYLAAMPNLTVLMPADGRELQSMLRYALTLDGPCAIRYPRGEAPFFDGAVTGMPINGQAVVVEEGKDVTILAAGNMLGAALQAGKRLKEKGYSPEIINPGYMKPLDWRTISESAQKTKHVVTIEDNVLGAGFGSAVASLFADRGMEGISLLRLGWPTKFIEQGSVKELMKDYGLDEQSIAERTVEFLEGKA